MRGKYREYFDVDAGYFPCIDEAAINAGAPWDNTYPHSTFVDMLSEMERALARQNNGKTLWIDGAYGSGKSQCALALRRILEVPENNLREYWDKYEPLKNKMDLLDKIIGHKKSGIVVAYRYASGSITSARDLFFAIQESVKAALIQQNVSYCGENTLKESIIAWLEDTTHKNFFNDLLQSPDKRWKSRFPQLNADDVIKTLRESDEVIDLVKMIFQLADDEGITALQINSDRLIRWLTDIIEKNNKKIVLIWDEFSDYFRQNRESLSEFQKIASLVQDKPFFLIIVTHESQQIYFNRGDKGNQSKISDRFIPISITMPDNIAFELIGHALNVKPDAKGQWMEIAGEFNDRIKTARSKVMDAAKITDPESIKKIMPLHPMAALSLKHIASTFNSNQRSMFDFIKTLNADNNKAFQWFIENVGPYDDHPLLTVDMLWNFFYEKGRDNLDPVIRSILDSFPQEQNLREDEKRVLKAILIMQAIDQNLGGAIDLLKPTGRNLSYVFEGISDLEGTAKAENIAKSLREQKILISNQINDGVSVYTAAVLMGDQTKIDEYKENIRQGCTTSKLVQEGELSSVLPLSPALRFRFECEPNSGKIMPVTYSDFKRTINTLRDSSSSWKFPTVIAFAKDDDEAILFREVIRNAVADEQNRNFIFIDALSTPLGHDAFDQYVEFSASSQYYKSKQNKVSNENAEKAKHILNRDWKDRIYSGRFIVYTHVYPEGQKINGQDVASVLEAIVKTKFPHVFDFEKKLTESQLKNSQMKSSAQSGINQTTSGIMRDVERSVLEAVWKKDSYWEDPTTKSLPISKIKIELDTLIEGAFIKDGQISIGDVYNTLEDIHGFSPCNLSSFLAGFLLKEYGNEPYRYQDSNGISGSMTPEKLAEMLSNYIGKPNSRQTFIIKMTADEKEFYKITEKIWDIDANSCSSIEQAKTAIINAMCKLGLPLWCLEGNANDAFGLVQKYIEFVQKEGREAHEKALEIGKIASTISPIQEQKLSEILTIEECQNRMLSYLNSFEDGEILKLAKDIGAENNVISDIRQLFEVKYSCIWDKKIGEDEIRKLLIEYRVVYESNNILGRKVSSLNETYRIWCERLNFIAISYEKLYEKHPTLKKILDILLNICEEKLPLPQDRLRTFHSELMKCGTELKQVLEVVEDFFATTYESYLEDFSREEIRKIQNSIGTGLFILSKSECDLKVKSVTDDFRKEQSFSKLSSLWKEKTKTKNPFEWSKQYRTPILCLVPVDEFESAKNAFNVLNHTRESTEDEITSALKFLKSATLFDSLTDEKKRDKVFHKNLIGVYCNILTDLGEVRDVLDRLPIEVYDWRDNPRVNVEIERLAKEKYSYDLVVSVIDGMDEAELKQYLKTLVKTDIVTGIKILSGRVERV